MNVLSGIHGLWDHLQACVDTYAHSYVHVYIYIYAHVYTYIHIYIYTYIHIYIYTYIHIYIYTYIHIYIYIRCMCIDTSHAHKVQLASTGDASAN